MKWRTIELYIRLDDNTENGGIYIIIAAKNNLN